MQAKSVIVWKDVNGIYNADPKEFEFAEVIPEIDYYEAIELAYFGAKVIHPKTIKPLQNNSIPLCVKSFLNPENNGTIIKNKITKLKNYTSFIVLKKQVLVSISALDYSFIVERNLSEIFSLFANYNTKINLMESSAISFSVCFTYDDYTFEPLIKSLQNQYKILYNKNLSLFTLRNYTKETISQIIEDKPILIMQKSRNTARIVTT